MARDGAPPLVYAGAVSDAPLARYAARGSSHLLDVMSERVGHRTIHATFATPRAAGRFTAGDWTEKRGPFADLAEDLRHELGAATGYVAYCQAESVPNGLPELVPLTGLPFLPTALLEPSTPRLWLGTGGHRVDAHFDTEHNLACVLAGRKRFTLFPPEQLPNMYVGPLDRSPSGVPVSMVDVANPDLTRFPRFAQAQQSALVADLEPGDALFVPAYWWHHVESIGFSAALTYYWDDVTASERDAYDAAFVHALMTVRPLSRQRKQMLRIFYDYFVFERSGDPYGHMPEEQQGLAGSVTVARQAALRSKLVRAMTAARVAEMSEHDLWEYSLVVPASVSFQLDGTGLAVRDAADGSVRGISHVLFQVLREFSTPRSPREVMERLQSEWSVERSELCEVVLQCLRDGLLLRSVVGREGNA